MPENALQTLQQLIQDVIAPDVRELKLRLASFEKQVDIRFTAMDEKMDVRFAAVDLRFAGIEARFAGIDARFSAMDQKMDIQFQAILAAIAESKAQSELVNLRVIATLSERVAVLEARSH